MLRNSVAVSLLVVLAHAANSMAVQELSVNSLVIAPGATDTLVVSGNVDVPNFGVTILVVLSPQGGNTGTLTFTPGPADILQLGHPWATQGVLTIFDADGLGLPSEQFYTDLNGSGSNEGIVFNGPLAGFPVVSSAAASGVWNVSLSSAVFGLDSTWEASPTITTTRIAGTITIGACPTITQQPVSQVACEGDGATFTVAADGSPPLSFQWRRNGSPIGTDSNTLIMNPVTAALAGSFDVVITNSCGSVTSSLVTLTVWPKGGADTNGDGSVDGRDIKTFLDILLNNPTGPGSPTFCAANLNSDAVVDLLDVDLFVAQLLGPLPLGACCFIDGSCQDGLTQDQCIGLGGDAFMGIGSNCASVTCPVRPDNDTCVNAAALSAGPGVFAFDTTDASGDGFLHAACDGSQIDADVWYCWQADCSGVVQIDTCGQTAADTKIAVYDVCDGALAISGAPCAPTDQNLLACDDNACGLQSSVLFSAVSGQSYLIRLGASPGQPGGTGTFTIGCLGNALGGDDCANALAIAGDGSFGFSTLGATTDGLADAACDFFGRPQIENDVWFCWTASCTGTTTVQTCGTTLDTKLAAYGGCTCPTAAPPLDCNDDSAACGGVPPRQSSITFPTTAGATYLLRIGSFSAGDTGSGTFTIACTP